IGIVMEALNAPQSIEALIDVRLLPPTTAESRAVPVADLDLREVVWQAIDVENGICARAGERAHVDQCLDLCVAQHGNEFVQAAVGMADGGKLRHRHLILVSAPSLWAAI